MFFKLIYSNHKSAVQLEDLLILLHMLLETAGHQAEYDNRLYPGDYCNVLVERFGPGMEKRLQELNQTGAQTILVATEFITGSTFNDFPEDYGDFYSAKEY